jgi:hypothetical protein
MYIGARQRGDIGCIGMVQSKVPIDMEQGFGSAYFAHDLAEAAFRICSHDFKLNGQ